MACAAVQIKFTMPGASSAVTIHKEFGTWFFNDFLAEMLESGKFVPSPKIDVVDVGLETGIMVGLERYNKGVSETKIVVPLVI